MHFDDTFTEKSLSAEDIAMFPEQFVWVTPGIYAHCTAGLGAKNSSLLTST